jgi:hypothetical protein
MDVSVVDSALGLDQHSCLDHAPSPRPKVHGPGSTSLIDPPFRLIHQTGPCSTSSDEQNMVNNTLGMLLTVYRNSMPTNTLTYVCWKYLKMVRNSSTPVKAILDPMEYCAVRMQQRILFPISLPFLMNNLAMVITESVRSHKHTYGIMDDVVAVIRGRATATLSPEGEIVFQAPTGQEIKDYMQEAWPHKYNLTQKGWQNSVNQCLTHGQGWNFLKYVIDAERLNRYVLFERAYNGRIVLGSGQCKKLHDDRRKT